MNHFPNTPSFLHKGKFPIFCKDTNETCYDYKSYIKSRHWMLFKTKYYKSKLFKSSSSFGGINGMCICCQIPNLKLDIHHLTYKRLGQEKMMDVIPLCRSCHGLVHEDIKNHIYNYGRNDAWMLIRSRSWRRVRRSLNK